MNIFAIFETANIFRRVSDNDSKMYRLVVMTVLIIANEPSRAKTRGWRGGSIIAGAVRIAEKISSACKVTFLL